MVAEIGAVFFDFGGTLRTTVPDKELFDRAVARMMMLVGATDSPEEFYQQAAKGSKAYKRWSEESLIEALEAELWTRWMLPNYPSDKVAPLAEELGQLWRNTQGRRVVRPDAKHVVAELVRRGYRLGVISNTSSTSVVQKGLADYGLAEYFPVVILSSVLGIRKPSPKIFFEAAQQLGVNLARAAYVGDQISRDVLGAQRAGLGMTIIIGDERKPGQPADSPARPDIVIQALSELLDIFRNPELLPVIPQTSSCVSRSGLYRSTDAPVPSHTLAWNMYGPGVENTGRNGKPEKFDVPQPASNQLLVRVDAVSLCFSDVKLIKQGGKHPKLYNRDLAVEPTRLGHEVALTVMQVGVDLQNRFYPGQRLGMQPDIYQNGRSTAYGYTIPGGLTQFHLIGSEVLHGDAGAYVFPVETDLGYAEVALTEPWACVVAAYTQRRRLTPKRGGMMWIVGRPGDSTEYQFSCGLDTPGTIVVTDIPMSLLAQVEKQVTARGARLIHRDGLLPTNYATLKREFASGFDDIVMLDPRSAEIVSLAAKLIVRRGTFNVVGRVPLDANPLIDVGRIHYDYTAYLGNSGTDIGASYGEAHNRCELRRGGVALFVGAGGPMGQMHIQRALEMPDGPATILATDIRDIRLNVLRARFETLANKNRKRFVGINSAYQSLHDFVLCETQDRGVDDVVVCVPSADVMAEAAQVMASNGMLVFFAGVPNGTLTPLNLSDVYLHNAQFTGTSGSALADQIAVVQSAQAGELSPNQSVAAIGGIEAASDGICAMMEGGYPGKIVIFPQISGLPLTGLSDLKMIAPKIAQCLGQGDVWTREAEAMLIEQMWKP